MNLNHVAVCNIVKIIYGSNKRCDSSETKELHVLVMSEKNRTSRRRDYIMFMTGCNLSELERKFRNRIQNSYTPFENWQLTLKRETTIDNGPKIVLQGIPIQKNFSCLTNTMEY